MPRLLALLTIGLLLSACGGGSSRGGTDQIRSDQAAADRTMTDAIGVVASTLDGDLVGGRGSWIHCDYDRGVQYASQAQVELAELADGSLDRVREALDESGFSTASTEDGEGIRAVRQDLPVVVGLTQAPGQKAYARLTLETSCRHYDEDDDALSRAPTTYSVG